MITNFKEIKISTMPSPAVIIVQYLLTSIKITTLKKKVAL